ncbi:MAG: type II toxin-antitoxin system VapC family toxin [Candidatus Micrarchaeaceae archaeon]
MILVDTSVWIDHLRSTEADLVHLLEIGQVYSHPFIVGELALGNLRQRDTILTALTDLPEAVTATNNEVLRLIKSQGLAGRGIGFIDAHLIASVKLTGGMSLWTRDKRLRNVSEELKMSFEPSALR